ncbi:MAG TPA: DnaB-like helicase C-terminal domain-containing protein [Caulobacteraceae bacterium]|nr:DnaB-like helicase C-terminal domain-containing protein [Caulobacteraceae bacterium]
MALAPALDLRPSPAAPPFSLEAEQALLGAALFDPEAFHAAPSLEQEAFYEPLHGRLWRAIGELIAAGRCADPTTAFDRLRSDLALAELGGLRYLAELVDKAPPASRASTYAEMIADLSARRAVIRLVGETAERAGDTGTGSAHQVIADTEAALAQVAAAGVTRSEWRSAGDVARMAIDRAMARSSKPDFPSGLAELDELTGGFARGELAVIAGRPGMGKSVAGLTIAKANAVAGRGVLLFSLEMAADAVGLRLASDVAYDPHAVSFAGSAGNPTFDRARRNGLGRDEWALLHEAAETIARWPLRIDDRASLTVAQMEACARRQFRAWQREGTEPGPVIIDHLGIVRSDRDRRGNKVQETGDVSRGLAEMAKRLDVPVVALCQINRASEGREDKRPSLAELRWSGAIEEDARLVMFLHRPAYYFRAPEDGSSETAGQRIEREGKEHDARNKLFWIIAKQNSGPVGQVETFVEIGCASIRDRRELWR